MRKLVLLSLLTLLLQSKMHSQNELGVKIGLASYDLPQYEIGSTHDLKMSVLDATYGFQLGVYGRLGLWGLYIQPELLFNSNAIRYKIENLGNVDTLSQIFTTRYHDLDIPVLIVITPSIFKIYAGPVGHYHFDKISEFTSKTKIREALDNLTYGYQFGGGISFQGFTLDVRYEGNFSKTFKRFIIDDKEFEMDKSPARVIFSIMFAF